MSASPIATHSPQLIHVEHDRQPVQSQFNKTGNELQTGKLTEAQTDLVTLSQSSASGPSTWPTPVPPDAVNSQKPPYSVGPHAPKSHKPPDAVSPNAVIPAKGNVSGRV